MMKKILFASSLIVIALTAGTSTYAADTQPHWEYKGYKGPYYWGTLSKDFHLCKDGKNQSPVNIKKTSKASLDPINFGYNSVPKDIINNGYTIQVNMNTGSKITIDEKVYRLLHIQFHSPSEHKINGKAADMVAHFIHRSYDGEYGAIAVMLMKGEANATLSKLWKHIPKHKGQKNDLTKLNINIAGLLPENKNSYYTYPGSLTAPPCTENVKWMILKNRLTVSEEQIKAFTDIFPLSARPTQSLNGHVVKTTR